MVILKADKDNTVVITEKNIYIKKIKEVISDTSKFEQENIDECKQLNVLLESEKKSYWLDKTFRKWG